MNAQHTPGPWMVYPDSFGGHSIAHSVTKQGVGSTIPLPRFDGKNREQSQAEATANARLIAAAPDLLGACINALERLKEIESAYDVSIDPTLSELRSAIAKAMCPIPTPTPL